MKVLNTGSKKWSKKIKCHECKAWLEVEVNDLKAGNFAIGYDGETWAPELYVECGVCQSDLRLKDNQVPSGIRHKLFDALKEKLGL